MTIYVYDILINVHFYRTYSLEKTIIICIYNITRCMLPVRFSYCILDTCHTLVCVYIYVYVYIVRYYIYTARNINRKSYDILRYRVVENPKRTL